MTTLSKEIIESVADKYDFSEFSSEFKTSIEELYKFVAELELLARADLVAENERLKEAAMFFSTYTDPDELEMDEIENAARESFRRANSGVRGTTITRANSYESHVIWATKARISNQLTATRTALAAAEADNERLRDALLTCQKKQIINECAPSVNYKTFDSDLVAKALAQPRDDSALREMIATAIDEFVHLFKRHVGGDGEFWLHELEDYRDSIRALAEKAKGE